MSESLQNIRIVLVETSHPGNIGSAARAMKTMGLTDLVLVKPKHFPADGAIAMAAGAEDMLDTAGVVESLQDALQDCHRAYALTARSRTLANPPADLRTATLEAAELANGDSQVAFVFGRERSGLTNQEIDLCHRIVHVGANPDYPSLNLAAAVQLVAYELRVALVEAADTEATARELPPSEELERFYAHLEQVLIDIDFLDPDNPRLLMRRMRNLFGRAELDANEVNILRGVLAHVEKQRTLK